MAQYYFSAQLDNDRALFIAPISDVDLEMSGEIVTDASGYFLYERCYSSPDAPITLLARLHSEEAAFQMSRMLNLH
jgi:hypothetical protein